MQGRKFKGENETDNFYWQSVGHKWNNYLNIIVAGTKLNPKFFMSQFNNLVKLKLKNVH